MSSIIKIRENASCNIWNVTRWCLSCRESDRCTIFLPLASQEISHLLWNQKVHYRFHNPLLVPILSQMNPVHIYHPISLRSILILSSNLRQGLPSGLFPFKFCNQNSEYIIA
jgi:hypothetical protein